MKLPFVYLLLTFIVLFATLVRFYKLEAVPAGLNRDEAALAYNAVVLQKTGRDEWNKAWPLALKSFGDYKLPGYVWTLVGVFTIFDANDFWVRFPAAVSGVLLVPLTYLVAKNLGFKSFTKLWIAFQVGFSPFLIFYSRMAWEAMVALALFIGVWVFVTSQKVAWWKDGMAVLLLLLAIFTYNTPLLLSPLVLAGVIFSRGVLSPRKWVVFLVGAVIVVVFGAMQLQETATQKSGITIFSDPTVWTHFVEYRTALHPLWQRTLGNWYVYLLGLMFVRFEWSWLPPFLLLSGGQHPWHQVPNTGHIWFSSYLLAYFGAGWVLLQSFQLLLKSNFLRWRRLLFQLNEAAVQRRWRFWWMLMTPAALIPAVVTVDAPHATRSLFFLVCLLFLSGFGLEKMHQKVMQVNRFGSKIVLGLVFFISCLQLGFYLQRYFQVYPEQSQRILRSDLKEIVRELELNYPQQPVAIVDEDGYLYTMVAWYAQLPPSIFLTTLERHQPTPIGLWYGAQVGRYHFIQHKSERRASEQLLVQWEQDHWNIHDISRFGNP